MTLEVYEASRGSLLDELGVKLLVAGDERNVHQRAILRNDGTLEQLALVEEIIKDLSLLLVVSLHSLEAAHLLYPLEHLAADVDSIAVRSVVEGIVVSLGLPLEHGGCSGENIVGDEILADN